MALINVHEIQTVWGSKIIELHQGDITKPEIPQECLLVSAFSGKYKPIKNTILGALHEQFQINLEELLLDAEIDIRSPFHTWISKELNIEGFHYKRIACMEMVGTSLPIENMFTNMFSMLMLCEAQKIKISSIAMPLLGTGNQGLKPEDVLPFLLEKTNMALKNVSGLNRVVFIERSEAKSEMLDKKMNKFLKRDKSLLKKIPENDISKTVIAEMKSNLLKIQNHLMDSETLDELIHCLDSENARILELGILGRRLLERLIIEILGVKKLTNDLLTSIDRLSEKKIAPWMTSYMHIVRTFGNHVAHDQAQSKKLPAQLSDQDLTNYLFCLNRVLDFWLDYQNKKK